MSVLICYDGSPSARAAVARAASTLDQAGFARHEVTLVHVWNAPMAATDSFNYREGPGAPSAERLIDVAESGAQETVDEGRRVAIDCGLTPNTLIARNESSVAATILRVAEQQDSSLIVVGSHPHGSPGPTLDSISAAVIAASTRPVLVIPMTGADEASVLATAHQSADGVSTQLPEDTARWGA